MTAGEEVESPLNPKVPVVVIVPPVMGKVVAILVTVPVLLVYPALVFSASVHTSKQFSTSPVASTPRGALPEEQLSPLVESAVAVSAFPVRVPVIVEVAVSVPTVSLPIVELENSVWLI